MFPIRIIDINFSMAGEVKYETFPGLTAKRHVRYQ
jgi:hypothetical protein